MYSSAITSLFIPIMTGGYLQDHLWIRPIPSRYTPEQVALYLTTVGWKNLPSEDELSAGRLERSVETLEQIMLRHLLTFPWENTGMHYTEDHHMDVSPEGAYDLLVRKGRGSYCFGQNQVFLEILRGLGFRAYGGAARVNQNWSKPDAPRDYTSHTHMVIFVQPDDRSNETYVVDVGFGSGALTRPIPLVAGDASVVQGIGPTEVHRLAKAPLPHSSLTTSLDGDGPSGQDIWTLEVWHGKGDHANEPWKVCYSFSELEFFPKDATDGSFVVNQSNSGIFASQVMCVKVFEGEEGRLYRKVLFGKHVTQQVDGESEVIRTLETELDRVRALREVFGVQLEDSAVDYIQGRLPAF